MAVVAYQTVGMLVEWAMTGSLQAALQDIWLGYPGIFLQIVGGWLILRYVLKDLPSFCLQKNSSTQTKG